MKKNIVQKNTNKEREVNTMEKRTIVVVIILLILAITASILASKMREQQQPSDCHYATIFRYDGEQSLTIKEYYYENDMIVLITERDHKIVTAKENVILSTTYQAEDK